MFSTVLHAEAAKTEAIRIRAAETERASTDAFKILAENPTEVATITEEEIEINDNEAKEVERRVLDAVTAKESNMEEGTRDMEICDGRLARS